MVLALRPPSFLCSRNCSTKNACACYTLLSILHVAIYFNAGRICVSTQLLNLPRKPAMKSCVVVQVNHVDLFCPVCTGTSAQKAPPYPPWTFSTMEFQRGSLVCYVRPAVLSAKLRVGPGKKFPLTDKEITNGKHAWVDFVEDSWALVSLGDNPRLAGWLHTDYLIPAAPLRPVPS